MSVLAISSTYTYRYYHLQDVIIALAFYIHLVAGGGGCGHIGPRVFATDKSIMARREPPRAPRRDKTGANSVTSFWSRVWFENIAWTWKGLLHNFCLIGPLTAARQQPSVLGVCGPIRKTDWLLQKDVTESAPVLLQRAPSTANCRWCSPGCWNITYHCC